jgi:hypothetical protein
MQVLVSDNSDFKGINIVIWFANKKAIVLEQAEILYGIWGVP